MREQGVSLKFLGRGAILLFFCCGVTSAYAGSWNTTGSLSQARRQFSAIRLSSGNVLACGGYNGSTLASCEVYNASTGTWSGTGSMSTARRDFRMVLLSDGKVLAAGGQNGPPASPTTLSSAELYNPNTGTWSSAASMGTQRTRFGMLLLNDGKVVAVGGHNGTTTLNSAELYNPSTNVWSNTGSMSSTRQSMGLVLLGNGKVLAAGGDDLTTGLTSAEIYDPSPGSWSSTGSQFYAIKNAGWVVISSSQSVTKVLRTGGQFSNNAAAPYTEIYDSSTGSWSTATSLGTARFSFGLARLTSGDLLAFAGSTLSSWLTSSEKYNVSGDTWSSDGSLNTSRAQFATVILSNGKVLAIGGYNGTYLSSVEIYTP